MRRSLTSAIKELALDRNKMAFVSGPRQVGKTTLSKQLGTTFNKFVYKNWDQDLVARQFAKNPEVLLEEFDLAKASQQRLLVLDEIHKAKHWKTKIKGIYDIHQDRLKILVTGSARLNLYKKGGDSLLGRYLNFRLHPLSLGELNHSTLPAPDDFLANIFKPSGQLKVGTIQLDELMTFSGFPEPFLAKNKRVQNIWRKDRKDKIIREDLRDLNRVQEISQLQVLGTLLPEKVGSPLSIESLREDLSTSHESVNRWLSWFQDLYLHFEIRPWSKNIKRSLKKERKVYLYDWTEIDEKGFKFENLIASHLLKACHAWTDLGFGEFELYYLRNKEKQEIDFLVTQNRKPWLAVEAKLAESKINEKIFKTFRSQIKCPIVQVTLEEDIFWHDRVNSFYSMSAVHFLRYLP